MKGYHHVNLDKEFKADCQVWLLFLDVDLDRSNIACYRPFLDILGSVDAIDIGFYMDASAKTDLGFGRVLGEQHWFSDVGRSIHFNLKPFN